MAVAAIGLALTAASTAVSVEGSIQASAAAKAAGNANKAADIQNANFATEQADAQATQIRQDNARVAARQRVAFLSSGMTLTGSSQDVIYDSSLQGELNALNTEYKGKVGAYDALHQANIDATAGITRSTAYEDDAIGTLLAGGGRALSLSKNPNFSQTTNTPAGYG